MLWTFDRYDLMLATAIALFVALVVSFVLI
jgi:hypothetical protein